MGYNFLHEIASYLADSLCPLQTINILLNLKIV